MRARAWQFLARFLTTSIGRLKQHREAWQALHEKRTPNADEVKPVQEKINHTSRVVDDINTQLFFTSAVHSDGNEPKLDTNQTRRFWLESEPLLRALAGELHPHTAYTILSRRLSISFRSLRAKSSSWRHKASAALPSQVFRTNHSPLGKW